MYNHYLDTFIATADCGSFTKAADILFMTPAAVMKQINNLEKHLDLQLLKRTPAGVTLTPAGKILYHDAKFIIDYSDRALAGIREVVNKDDKTFNIGTSRLNSAKPFMDLWYKLDSAFPDYNLHLIPYNDKYSSVLSEISQLGKKFDFMIGINDSKSMLSKCRYLKLGQYDMTISMSRKHRLADREFLTIHDLYGETLIIVNEGDSPTCDNLRKYIKKEHPRIIIEDAPRFYDYDLFNHCAETNHLMLSFECWKDVHPGLKTLPVDWSFSNQYCLLYGLEPSDEAIRFVDTVMKYQSANKLQ